MSANDLIDRLESLAVREKAEIAAVAARLFPDAGVRHVSIADGIAVHGGDAIGVSSLTGAGISRTLSAEEHEQLREFLDGCTEGRVEASVVAGRTDPGLLATLDSCGLRPIESECVLVMELPAVDGGGEPVPWHDAGDPVVVEQVPKAQRAAWAHLVATAFSDGGSPPPVDLRFAECITHRSGVTLFRARLGAHACGAGELWTGEGVAWLSADATLPAYRRRGIQAALQRGRIDRAVREGCGLAVTEAVPGTSSAGNALRLGFRVAYTRTIFGRDSA